MPEYEDLLNEYDELSKNNGASRKSGSAFGALDNKKNGNSSLDNIKAKAGSAAMQSMGVPKPLADIAGNKLANKFGKNGGSDKVPEALKKRGSNMPGVAPGGMPNSSNKSGTGSALKSAASSGSGMGADGLGSALNSMMGSKQDGEQQEKGVAQKATEEIAAKGGSVALQSFGVPKPLADIAAKKFAQGPGLKIAIIYMCVVCVFWFLVIALMIYLWMWPILKGLELIDEVQDGFTSFFSSADNFINGNGWCATDAECQKKAEEEFYDKVQSLSKDYPRVDMSLVMASVLYKYNADNGLFSTGNSDYCETNIAADDPNRETLIAECESKTATGEPGTEGYKEAKDNLSKVAKKLSKGKDEFDNYMVKEFIPENYSEYMNSVNNSSNDARAKVILDEIYAYSRIFSSFRNTGTVISGAGICTYKVNNVDISNLKVRLLECAWEGDPAPDPIPGEELVDFEKYIMGITYGESYGFADEEYKAQAIAARSFSLRRKSIMGDSYNIKLEKEGDQWILQLRNCTADHVYCDPDKGCWSDSDDAGDTVHSGYEAGHAWSKGPLPEDDRLREAVNSVKGMVLVDSSGDIIYTSYTHTEQTRWNEWAKSGMDYNEILKKEYSSGNSIISNCTAGLSGEWDTWRQCDSRWGSIKLGTGSDTTICDIGCLVTSISTQIARSGTAIYLPSGVKEFNPGTFVQYSGIQFTTGGGLMYGDQWNKEMAPGFVRVGGVSIPGNKAQKVQQMAEYIKQGYFPIIQVKYPTCDGCTTHFVPVTGTNGNDILMIDPASDVTEVFAKYPSGASSAYNLEVMLFERTD